MTPEDEEKEKQRLDAQAKLLYQRDSGWSDLAIGRAWLDLAPLRKSRFVARVKREEAEARRRK